MCDSMSSIPSHQEKASCGNKLFGRAAALFCGVSSQISSYVRMRLASSPLSPPDQQHPAAENLTGPHACIALLRYSRELPRLLLYFS